MEVEELDAEEDVDVALWVVDVLCVEVGVSVVDVTGAWVVVA